MYFDFNEDDEMSSVLRKIIQVAGLDYKLINADEILLKVIFEGSKRLAEQFYNILRDG